MQTPDTFAAEHAGHDVRTMHRTPGTDRYLLCRKDGEVLDLPAETVPVAEAQPWPVACPVCGRAALGRAFGSSARYLRDSAGHVFETVPS